MLCNFRKWAYSFYLGITRFRHLLEFCLQPVMVMARQNWWPVVVKQIFYEHEIYDKMLRIILAVKEYGPSVSSCKEAVLIPQTLCPFLFIYFIFSPLLPFFCFPLFSIYFPSSLTSCPPPYFIHFFILFLSSFLVLSFLPFSPPSPFICVSFLFPIDLLGVTQ